MGGSEGRFFVGVGIGKSAQEHSAHGGLTFAIAGKNAKTERAVWQGRAGVEECWATRKS